MNYLWAHALQSQSPYIPGLQIVLLLYNVDEMPQEPNSCVYQLACGKQGSLCVVSLQDAEPTNDIKWGLTVRWKGVKKESLRVWAL